MPTLKDLSLMTSELDRLGGELHSELTEGEIDFEKMVDLADTMSDQADRLAAAFNTNVGGSTNDAERRQRSRRPGR